jgi:hypothetical protein
MQLYTKKKHKCIFTDTIALENYSYLSTFSFMGFDRHFSKMFLLKWLNLKHKFKSEPLSLSSQFAATSEVTTANSVKLNKCTSAYAYTFIFQ